MTSATTMEPTIFDRVDVPEEFLSAAREQGWPEGLVERALRLRTPRRDVEWWLNNDGDLKRIASYLDARERLMFGTLRAREAAWSDDEAVADLYANSPEEIGDWEVTVERSPYPFAQFLLQENPNIQVLEDRGIMLGAAAHSARNTLIEGKRVTCHIASAWRVRKEFRGQGLTNVMRVIGGPACAWFGLINYWYVRSGNFDAVNWVKALRPDLADAANQRGGELPGLPVSVHHFRSRPYTGDAARVRKGRRSDASACVALINRTHRGLDLFRPYTVDFLQRRLDDRGWGPKPHFIVHVYDWNDYYVLEEGGRIVACAGLWDRGRDVREVWRHKETGETTVIEATALMDFGYAEGREDAMARLLGYLIGVSHDLCRQELLAPIEQLPALLECVASFEPGPETRHLAFEGFHEGDLHVDAEVKRPYTDLAYW
jgi:hypothetical protein